MARTKPGHPRLCLTSVPLTGAGPDTLPWADIPSSGMCPMPGAALVPPAAPVLDGAVGS